MTELLIAFFFLSILANAIFIWYLKENTTRLIFISKNIGHLLDIVLEYREHLKTISELELFYGDENIINLIKHTKFMVEEIDKFKEIYSITEEEINPEDAANQEEERQKEKEE
jgi:hypothetical protein